jgi:hypothetical protein
LQVVVRDCCYSSRLRCRRSCLALLIGWIWQELFEFFEQIWIVFEEPSDLLVDFLNSVLLVVIGVQYLQEGLVDVRLILEADLDLAYVVARLIELFGILFLGRC